VPKWNEILPLLTPQYDRLSRQQLLLFSSHFLKVVYLFFSRTNVTVMDMIRMMNVCLTSDDNKREIINIL